MQIDLTSFVSKLFQESSIKKDIEWSSAKNMYLEFIKNNKRYYTYKHNINMINTIDIYFDMMNISFLSQIDDLLLERFIVYCKGINNKAVTINKKISLIKRIYTYFVDKDLIEPKHFRTKKIKEVKPTIRNVDLDEEAEVIEYVREHGDKRQLLQILLLASTGLRRNELVHLRKENVDFSKNRIFLPAEFTKTNDEAYIYINEPEVLDLLKDILPGCKEWIFEYRGNPVSADSITRYLNRIKVELGYNHSISPHKWRHSFATYLLRDGANIKDVQSLMRHSNILTTSMYLHNTEEERINTYLAHNPLNIIRNQKKED